MVRGSGMRLERIKNGWVRVGGWGKDDEERRMTLWRQVKEEAGKRISVPGWGYGDEVKRM